MPRPSKRAAWPACRAWAPKQIEKLRKGIDDYRRSAGRFRIDVAEEAAQRIAAYLLAFPGIERVTPAGSLRRGRETVGDLDLLVTGPAFNPSKPKRACRGPLSASRNKQPPQWNMSPPIPASTT